MTYETVNEILHAGFGWKANAYPDRGAVEQYLADGHTAEETAARLDAFCASVPVPEGHGFIPSEWRSYALFGEGHHWRPLHTSQALGIAPLDPPADVLPFASSAQEALIYAKQGRHVDGSLGATPEELALREAYYSVLPVDYAAVEPVLMYALVLWGICPRVFPDFGTGRFRPELYVTQTLRSYVAAQRKLKGLPA